MQLADLGAHLHPQLGVEVGERFVKEEYLGLADDGAPHRHALTLTARKRFGLALQQVLDAEYIGRFLHSRLNLVFGIFPQFKPKGHVLIDAHVRVERVILEDHSNVAILGGHIVDDRPIYRNLAGGDFLEPGDHPQRRRFAAARRADEYHEFFILDLDIGIIYRYHFFVVHFADILQNYFSHRVPFLLL